MGEVIAVYDNLGAEIGSADRAEVYERGLWHASAGVLVRSLDGHRLYVHRRTETKMVFAGMHDCLAGGVLAPGEDPGAAAARELAEELGIVASAPGPRPLARTAWDGLWNGRPMRCHLFAYEVRSDGPITHQRDEIAAGWWWTDAQLRGHLADPSWPFVPDTRVLVDRLLRDR
ncbi:NUDIX domain-containing protein [Nocardia spumae]|uniref:NUDIX domain-containing protein n=1 Tax=Nocardia spumae TaxID=2887190 RepID=UPI001D155395|nr:NUDIX domain-containing protein [Nocardia spumae]